MKIRFGHVLMLAIFGCAIALVFMLRNNAAVNGGAWVIELDNKGGTEAVVLKWSGAIDPPMASSLRKAFNEHKEAVSKVRIELNSPGGSVEEGVSVVGVIERMKKTHRVETYVGSGAECLSMCVPIYLQGDFLVTTADPQWMFHEVTFTDALTGEEAFAYQFETRQASLQMFFRHFENSDMDSEWRKKLTRDIQGQEIWKTGRELKRERSIVVMVVE